MTSKAVDEFVAEFERRYGHSPSADDVRLEELREAIHAGGRTAEDVAAFKEQSDVVASKRTELRSRGERAGSRLGPETPEEHRRAWEAARGGNAVASPETVQGSADVQNGGAQ